MKKLCLLLLPLLAFFTLSCHSQDYGILSYQEKSIEAECSLNGEYKILVTKDGEKCSVAFLEPTSLSTVSFTYENDKIVARAGEMEMPLNKEELDGVMAILNMFSLNEECLAYAGSGENGEVLEFISELGSYRLTMGENDVPKRIEITSESYEFDIAIEAMKLK